MHSYILKLEIDGRREGNKILHIRPLQLRDKEGVLGERRVVLTNTAASVDTNIQKR